MPVDSSRFSLGSSGTGSHYIDLWRTCPMLFYYRHRRPYQGGRGLEASTSPVPLMVGWVCHEALSGLYETGWQDGQWDLAFALEVAHAAIQFRKDEFEDGDAMVDCFAEVERLVRDYDAHYGPKGRFPEFPELRVAVVDGEPLIEKRLTMPVGSHEYSGRLDTVVEYQGSYYSLEHKTAAASRARMTMEGLRMGTQGRGQVALLRHAHPNLPVRGLIANVLVKNAAADKPKVHREVISFSRTEIVKAVEDIKRTFDAIEAADYSYHELQRKGHSEWDAALTAYTMNTNSCAPSSAYRGCSMSKLCRNLDHVEMMASTGFRVKHRSPTK